MLSNHYVLGGGCLCFGGCSAGHSLLIARPSLESKESRVASKAMLFLPALAGGDLLEAVALLQGLLGLEMG